MGGDWVWVAATEASWHSMAGTSCGYCESIPLNSHTRNRRGLPISRPYRSHLNLSSYPIPTFPSSFREAGFHVLTGNKRRSKTLKMAPWIPFSLPEGIFGSRIRSKISKGDLKGFFHMGGGHQDRKCLHLTPQITFPRDPDSECV